MTQCYVAPLKYEESYNICGTHFLWEIIPMIKPIFGPWEACIFCFVKNMTRISFQVINIYTIIYKMRFLGYCKTNYITICSLDKPFRSASQNFGLRFLIVESLVQYPFS